MSQLVTIAQYKNILKETTQLKDKGINLPLMVCGNHGIGKTQVTESYGKELGYNVVILNLANQTPEDLLGFPDGEGGFKAPKWLNTTDSSVKTIYFLDEINRAPKYVLQSMFNFINEGRIHQHSTFEGDIIIGASNPPSDDYDVTMFEDTAWNSRFCHLYLTPTRAEFIQFLSGRGSGDAKQSAILSALSNMDTTGIGVVDNVVAVEDRVKCTADNRNIARIFDIVPHIDNEQTIAHIINGLVGADAGQIFIQEMKRKLEIPSSEDILKMKATDEFSFDTQDLSVVTSINSAMAVYCRKAFYSADADGNKVFKEIPSRQKKALYRYTQAIPKDSAISLVKELKDGIDSSAPIKLLGMKETHSILVSMDEENSND